MTLLNLTTLPERRQRILIAYVRIVDEQEGIFPPPRPTIRQIMRLAGITSTSVARYNLIKLCDAGVMVRVRSGFSANYHLNDAYIESARSLAEARKQ